MMTNWLLRTREGVAEDDSIFCFRWYVVPEVKRGYRGGRRKIVCLGHVELGSVALSRQVEMWI